MPTNNTDNIYSTEYEDSGTPIPSTKIGYDNTESGLEATNAQGAIDEVAGNVSAIDTTLNDKYLLMGDFTLVASNKTYAQVVNSETGMLADVNTMLSELEDDEYVIIEGLVVPTFDVLHCTKTTLLNNQTTLSELIFRLVPAVTMSAILTADIEMKSSHRAVQGVMSNATPVIAFTDLELSEQTQDFTIIYKKYKKV